MYLMLDNLTLILIIQYSLSKCYNVTKMAIRRDGMPAVCIGSTQGFYNEKVLL